MANDRPGTASSYLDYLPPVFSSGSEFGQPNFLGRFLLAFEQVLTGLGDPLLPGIEEILDGGPVVDGPAGIHMAGVERYFDPGIRSGTTLHPLQSAPLEFLGWLAGWVALVPRGDVDEPTLRTLIANAVPLYRRRGTKQGLQALLRIYALDADIAEPGGRLQVGVSSTLGVDTWLGGATPHYFEVTAMVGSSNLNEIGRQRALLTAIIDAEKPIHTRYALRVVVPPTFELGVHSTIGKDTVLL